MDIIFSKVAELDIHRKSIVACGEIAISITRLSESSLGD